MIFVKQNFFDILTYLKIYLDKNLFLLNSVFKTIVMIDGESAGLN